MANNYCLFFARDGQVIRMPVNPEKVNVSKGNETDDYNVLALGPFMIPRIPALKVISWGGLFPCRPGDPFVLTPNQVREADFYLKFV